MVEQELQKEIADFRILGIPKFIKRDGEVVLVDRMVSTIIGARRCGKSFRLLQVAQDLIETGTIKSHEFVCPVDFDNPILSRMQASELGAIQNTFLRMTPNAGLTTPLLFLLDEIHIVEGWEQYVIDLSRNPHWRVIVTGSSSRMLRDDIATELRGKAISTTLRPLSFREFLRFQNYTENPLSTKGGAEALRLFDDYLRWGGYPAISNLPERHRPLLLREYFDTMILHDIMERYNVSLPRVCTHLFRYLLAGNAKPFTLQSILRYLATTVNDAGRDTIRAYIQHGVDAWLVSIVPLFTASLKEQERNYRKMYAVDWALANYNSPVWDGGLSRALENLVFLHLSARWPRVCYYLTGSKRQEVDFIVTEANGEIGGLFQVCIDPSDPQTLEREIVPLAATAVYFGHNTPVLLTRNHEKVIEANGVKVRMVPVWKWLLEV